MRRGDCGPYRSDGDAVGVGEALTGDMPLVGVARDGAVGIAGDRAIGSLTAPD